MSERETFWLGNDECMVVWDDHVELWAGEDEFVGGYPLGLAEDAARQLLRAYDNGKNAGTAVGRRMLQAQLRLLLEV